MSVLDAWRKTQLIKKGFACPKTRRRQVRSEFVRALESSRHVKALMFLAFAGLLATLVFSGQQPEQAQRYLFALLVFVTALAQLWINHPQTWERNSRVGLMLIVCFVHLLLLRVGLAFGFRDPELARFVPLVLPYAFAPLVISALLGKNQGIYTATFVSLWGAALWPNVDAAFLATSLIGGFVAVFVTFQVRRRGQLLRAGFFVGVAATLLGLCFGRIDVNWMFPAATDWRTVGSQALAAFGAALLTASLVSGLLPFVEGVFRITTAISWLEMSDRNHPILRRLSEEAPGTYHHSLEVAQLAEAAAETIGANSLMCQTASYFHDIGKLVKPEYFTENLPVDGYNPHDDLAPTMSALIIVAHVKEGVDLALKHNLNQQIIDVIQQHHGNSLVYFFYKRALQQREDARLGGTITQVRRDDDIPEVREETFRYPGPLPQTRECAIISLADAIQSASRSLEKPTPQRVEELVNDIIDSRVADHQLDACDLSFRELRKVAESFRHTLMSMLHRRIAYPKREKDPSAYDTRFNNSPNGHAPAAAANGQGSHGEPSRRREPGAPKTVRTPAPVSVAPPKAVAP